MPESAMESRGHGVNLYRLFGNLPNLVLVQFVDRDMAANGTAVRVLLPGLLVSIANSSYLTRASPEERVTPARRRHLDDVLGQDLGRNIGVRLPDCAEQNFVYGWDSNLQTYSEGFNSKSRPW